MTERQLRPAGDGIYGNLYLPRHVAARRPALLVFGGSDGGRSTGLAAALLAALGLLRAQPGVDPRHVLVSGVSRGGEAALLLGAHRFAYPVINLRHRDAGHLVGGLTADYASLTDDALTSWGGTVAGTQAAQADAHAKLLTLLAAQP